MLYINEWVTPPPTEKESSSPPAHAPASDLAREINRQLMSITAPQMPVAVHFYLGEGLRWIRVGFEDQAPVKPAAVANVGRVIASCLAPAETLYFHALRPHDLLFFLEDDKPKPGQVGMPPASYGSPLDTVLQAWRRAPV
jgi:hypothetical protein